MLLEVQSLRAFLNETQPKGLSLLTTHFSNPSRATMYSKEERNNILLRFFTGDMTVHSTQGLLYRIQLGTSIGISKTHSYPSRKICIMPSSKKSNKNKAKVENRNLNNETIAALKRLAAALKELDERGKSIVSSTNPGIPLGHWRDIPADVEGAYKMINDGAELIKAISTKYTLMGKISIEDGSKYSMELRQGCELISTAAFLVHQPTCGCARPTRSFIKHKSRGIVNSVMTLVESFVSLKALDGNVGAQLTGAVWQACDAVIEKVPKGNRACMRRELFTWVKDCNETMEEFDALIELGPAAEESSQTSEEEKSDEETWDRFCDNMGTGEQYSIKEISIVTASLALIKCSRGIIGLTLKACECAGEAVANLDKEIALSEDKNTNSVRKMLILQWISNLHETCRKLGDGATDLGCVMYPPLNLSGAEEGWTNADLGGQVERQKDWLLSAAHAISNPIPGDGQVEIDMSDEVKEMCSNLLTAIEKRSKEVEDGIKNAL